MKLSRADLYLLKRITSNVVKQGESHRDRIIEYYRIMREAAELEFNEDSPHILEIYLDHCYAESKEDRK